MSPARLLQGPAAALLLAACAAPAITPTDTIASVDDDPDDDGIVTAHEGEADPDGDRIPAFEDRDSDDDGLPDRLEAGDADPATFPVDSDGDRVPDFLDPDSDDNGRPDAREGRGDTDQDGTPDFADTDDDGDGLPDVQELPQGVPIDTDEDGTPDFRDPDSDNDGIDDAFEAKCAFVPELCDTDGDGVPDLHDLDSDGDGFTDAEEGAPGGLWPRDTDQDGTPDFRDLDSDGDSLADAEERDRYGTDPYRRDSDGDGLADAVELELELDPNDASSTWSGWVVELPERTEREESLHFELGLQRVDVVLAYDTNSRGAGHEFLLDTSVALASSVYGRVADPAFSLVQIGGYCDGNYSGLYREELARSPIRCGLFHQDVPLLQPAAFEREATATVPWVNYMRRAPFHPSAPYEAFVQFLEGPGRDDDCNGTYEAAWDTLPWRASPDDPFGGTAGDRATAHTGPGVRAGLGWRPFARPVLVWFASAQYTDPGVVHPDPDHRANQVRDFGISHLDDIPYHPYPVWSRTPPGCPSDVDYLRAADAVRGKDAFVLGVLATNDSIPSTRLSEYSMRRFLGELDQRIDLDGDGATELPFLTLHNRKTYGGEVPEFTAALQAALGRIENTIAFDRVRLEPNNDSHGLIASIDPPSIEGLKRGDSIRFTVTFRGTVPALDHDQVFRMGLNVLTDDNDLAAYQDILVVVPGRRDG